MNRGIEGRDIFRQNRDRSVLLGILEKSQQLSRVRLLAYCRMGSHYHTVLKKLTREIM